ncbi:MAG: hypothetical protein J6Y25_01495 [Elusimicrobiaceae bacterium]|nr:hypothetical protein [Elusimicrobiaceae bacterium]
MRTYRIILCVLAITISVAAAYSAFMYVYTDHMFAPVAFLTTPKTQAPHTPWPTLQKQTRFIHQVNTPQRAQRKGKRFAGLEVDVWGEELLAAHDEQEALLQTPLRAIFAAVKNPQEKLWWLDLKSEFSAAALDAMVQTAAQYNIPPENLLFETVPGPTAKLINQKKLALLLQLPEEFETDQNDLKRREEINAQTWALWEEYRPAAVSASFGKYGHLKTYFPDMPKAIYYSNTKRPSLKKSFMAAHIKKDPSVKIFMTDEYTYL